MLKLIQAILNFPARAWRIIFPPLIRERFGAYEDITARSNEELERLDKVIDMMPGDFLKFRTDSIMRLEKRAVKAYMRNVRHVNDVWLTNPKPMLNAATEQITVQNGNNGAVEEKAAHKKEQQSIMITSAMLEQEVSV
jgi:hypothetical protein